MKYIDAEKLIAEIRQHIHDPKQIEDWRYRLKMEEDNALLERIVNIITSLQQEQDSISEQFAKIVRENITEIGKDAQKQFEQLYFEITGTKMYGGYND